MMAAEEYLIVFQGVQRSGNTLAVLPKQATQENDQIPSAQRVAEITGRGLCWLRAYSPHGDARAKPPYPRPMACPVVASHPLRLSATASMRFNQWFPKEPLSLISGSLISDSLESSPLRDTYRKEITHPTHT
jgi:hypothetical protein